MFHSLHLKNNESGLPLDNSPFSIERSPQSDTLADVSPPSSHPPQWTPFQPCKKSIHITVNNLSPQTPDPPIITPPSPMTRIVRNNYQLWNTAVRRATYRKQAIIKSQFPARRNASCMSCLRRDLHLCNPKQVGGCRKAINGQLGGAGERGAMQ